MRIIEGVITVHRVPKGTFGKPLTVKYGQGGRRILGGHKPAKRVTNMWSEMGSANKRAAVPMPVIRFERPKRKG